MFKIRRNDLVYIITGKDRGKKGKVLKLFLREKRAIVEGINLMKKHRRKTREDQRGGVVDIESPLDISNLMLLCRHCNKPTRAGFKVLKDNTKTRFCKKCKEII